MFCREELERKEWLEIISLHAFSLLEFLGAGCSVMREREVLLLLLYVCVHNRVSTNEIKGNLKHF